MSMEERKILLPLPHCASVVVRKQASKIACVYPPSYIIRKSFHIYWHFQHLFSHKLSVQSLAEAVWFFWFFHVVTFCLSLPLKWASSSLQQSLSALLWAAEPLWCIAAVQSESLAPALSYLLPMASPPTPLLPLAVLLFDISMNLFNSQKWPKTPAFPCME